MNSNNFIHSGLINGQQYSYYIKAVYDQGESGRSNQISLLPQFIPQGQGTQQQPYLIVSIANLQWVSQNPQTWDKVFLQVNNIDASSTTLMNYDQVNQVFRGFAPIGDSTTAFSGTYYGNQKYINGLYINRQNTTNVGLFGNVQNGTINKLQIKNVNIVGNTNVGPIGRITTHSNISQVFTSGNVNGITTVGGLAGYIGQSTITNCYTKATVKRLSGTNANIGAFVGNNYRNNISNCYTVSTVIDSSDQTIPGKGFSGIVDRGGSYAMNSCYFDGQFTNQLTSPCDAIKRITIQMMYYIGYIDWLFKGINQQPIWNISNVHNQYPVFVWQKPEMGDVQQIQSLQGQGTQQQPYLINNQHDLYMLSLMISIGVQTENKHYQLTSNLDMSFYQDTWIPIGYNLDTPFNGIFNGASYIVQNLTFNNPNRDNCGLFGVVGGTIRRLGLLTSFIIGKSYVGGFIGRTLNTADIKCCFAFGQIQGLTHVGGFIGQHTGTINDCYSRVEVIRTSGNDANVGGFVGRNAQGSITNCYSTGRIRTIEDVNIAGKGFCGEVATGGNYAMVGNYWDTDLSQQTTTAGIATGRPTNIMRLYFNYIGWDFKGMSDGSQNRPHLIFDLQDLIMLRDQVNGGDDKQGVYYRVLNDIDLLDATTLEDGMQWNNGQGWFPIGTQTNPFKGNFDGNYKSIEFMAINRPQSDYQGLFGYCYNANIKAVILNYAEITGGNNVSPFGYMTNGTTLEFCGCSGYVKGANNVSGLCNTINSTIKNCYTHSDIIILQGQYYGLITSVNNNSDISNCYTIGSVYLSQSDYQNQIYSTDNKIIGYHDVIYQGDLYNQQNIYWDMQRTGITDASTLPGIIGLTSQQMSQPQSFNDWDFNYVWQIKQSLPYLRYIQPQGISQLC